MSRQIVMNRRGKPIGYIDTSRDGQQSAICREGSVLGIYDPRTGETLRPCGDMLADGNLLTQLLQQRR